jgi:hypothetical protein
MDAAPVGIDERRDTLGMGEGEKGRSNRNARPFKEREEVGQCLARFGEEVGVDRTLSHLHPEMGAPHLLKEACELR